MKDVVILLLPISAFCGQTGANLAVSRRAGCVGKPVVGLARPKSHMIGVRCNRGSMYNTKLCANLRGVIGHPSTRILGMVPIRHELDDVL